MVGAMVLGPCSLGLGGTMNCCSLCPSGNREVNYSCSLSDCAFGMGEEDFQSSVLSQDVCPDSAVPVLCLENCTFAYQAFSEYWMLVKITYFFF